MLYRPRELKLENPIAIKLLLSEKSFSLLQPFATTPTSLSVAAKLKDMSMSRYLYWVKKFVDLGLLVIAKEQARAGSNIKYYWIPADRLSIDLHDKPQILKHYYLNLLKNHNEDTVSSIVESVEKVGLELSIDVRSTNSNSLYSMIVNHSESTKTTLRQEFLKDDAPAVVAACRGLDLDYKAAKSLQNELWQLLDKYEGQASTGSQNYYFSMTLAAKKTK